jgi:hypothetical protein
MRRALLFTLALGAQTAQTPITLEIRVFHGADEVTPETRLIVYRAGDRTAPISQAPARDGRAHLTVPAGIYDAQAVRERDGRVVNIRWAERLVVMPYPDERGEHLEVVNFATGYGALQVRAGQGSGLSEIALYAAGNRSRPVAAPLDGSGYALFVVPAGRYDIQIKNAARVAWHPDIEVPLDRTRLWLIP